MRVFFNKPKQERPKGSTADIFCSRLDAVIADGVAGGIGLLSLADKLEARGRSLRVQNAITAPHASAISGPRVLVEERLTPRQIEALRREALGIVEDK